MTIKVAIRSGEPPERFLQRFKRICSKEGILKEAKKRFYFEKPSDRKRRRLKEQKKMLRKRARLGASGRRDSSSRPGSQGASSRPGSFSRPGSSSSSSSSSSR